MLVRAESAPQKRGVTSFLDVGRCCSGIHKSDHGHTDLALIVPSLPTCPHIHAYSDAGRREAKGNTYGGYASFAPVVGVILALLLRALVAPAYLLAINVLSYLAALGTTILITEKLFGWDRISYRIPLYLFIFLVALGSDYNIFITTRIRSV